MRATGRCVEGRGAELLPGCPSVSRPEHAAAVVAVEAVRLPGPGVHHARRHRIHGDRSYCKRTLRVSERCPARSPVPGFPDAPLGSPHVDDVRVRRIDRDCRHAAGRLVEVRNSARPERRPACRARHPLHALFRDRAGPPSLIARAGRLQSARRDLPKRIRALMVEIVQPIAGVALPPPALGRYEVGRHRNDGDTKHEQTQPLRGACRR